MEEIIEEGSLRKTEFFYDMKVGLKKIKALHIYNGLAKSTIDFIIISRNLIKKKKKEILHI